MEKNEMGGLETELSLGIPGGHGRGCDSEKKDKKRMFSDISGTNAVAGWPPVCTYRRSEMKMYVKVSMDGAPFLRKIGLSNHKGYNDFSMALQQLFPRFDRGKISKYVEESCEYIPIYEDKDGDWMLLGDVPWEMFIYSCRRLRFMKASASYLVHWCSSPRL